MTQHKDLLLIIDKLNKEGIPYELKEASINNYVEDALFYPSETNYVYLITGLTWWNGRSVESRGLSIYENPNRLTQKEQIWRLYVQPQIKPVNIVVVFELIKAHYEEEHNENKIDKR